MILVYYAEIQKELYAEIRKRHPTVQGFQSIDGLKALYTSGELPVLIVISQPDIGLLEALARFEWGGMLAHVGVRMGDALRALVFEDLSTFESAFQSCASARRERIQAAYIERLELSDAKDIAYIETLCGHPLPATSSSEGHSNRNLHKRLKRRKLNEGLRYSGGIIAVLGSASLAAALSRTYAEGLEGKLLVIDGNLLKPALDVCFGIQALQTPVKSHLVGRDNTGLNIALDAIAKGLAPEHILNQIVVHHSPRMDILLGNYNGYNYEYYEDAHFIALLEALKHHYQAICVSLPDTLYDSFTMSLVHLSTVNVLACSPQISDLRYMQHMMHVLAFKQGLRESKQVLITESDTSAIEGRVHQYACKQLLGNAYLTHVNTRKGVSHTAARRLSERMNQWA